MKPPLTYRDTGVDIDRGEEVVRRIAPLAQGTSRREVLGGIGAFAGLVTIPPGFREPVLVSSTDGVGSKLKVAFLADRHHTVGIDLVAMSVNDVLVLGAEPLYVLDYVAVARIDPLRVESIVRGVAEGCRQAGCALIGGETAELPDLYRAGEYDLAGFAVGIVERARIVDGKRVRPGDVVLGLASSGLHSNGYSLARRIVFGVMGLDIGTMLPGVGRSVADELLEPTRIYVGAVRELLSKVDVHAMAHITGGGLPGNVPRVLPEGCRAVVRRQAWRVPPIFRCLAEAGEVDEGEMFRTFNMGIGYVVIIPRAAAATAQAVLSAAGETVYELGEITSGERGVELA